MTLPEELQAAALTAVALGWLGKFIWEIIHRDRAAIDRADSDMQAQAKVLWSRVDTMRIEVEDLKCIIAVLKDRIEGLPDFERWDAKLQALRAELGSKLDKVSDQITETLVQIARIERPAGGN